MNLPSKELLSKVMPEAQITKDGEIIIDYFFSERIERVNIYELAFKCKEWARGNGFWLQAYIDRRIYLTTIYQTVPYTEDIKFKEDTETESIFKACQWILDNKGTK